MPRGSRRARSLSSSSSSRLTRRPWRRLVASAFASGRRSRKRKRSLLLQMRVMLPLRRRLALPTARRKPRQRRIDVPTTAHTSSSSSFRLRRRALLRHAHVDFSSDQMSIFSTHVSIWPRHTFCAFFGEKSVGIPRYKLPITNNALALILGDTNTPS